LCVCLINIGILRYSNVVNIKRIISLFGDIRLNNLLSVRVFNSVCSRYGYNKINRSSSHSRGVPYNIYNVLFRFFFFIMVNTIKIYPAVINVYYNVPISSFISLIERVLGHAQTVVSPPSRYLSLNQFARLRKPIKS